MPNATPTHIVELMLTLAITMPTLGCRQYADRLFDQGFTIGKSTVQNLLIKHGLGRRHQRLARAAAITALTTGLVTEVAVEDDPFGFCHWSGRPGGLVAVDSFYIGNLKGVGKVYQLTAVDTATRWAMVWLVHGTVNKDVSVAFFERIWKTWKRMGFSIEAIVADNGPEYKATKFADALAAKNVTRVFIPARSPNHNAVVERFQGTMLQECWRPAFHRLCSNNVRQLQRADAWCPPTTTTAATTATTCTAGDQPTSSNYTHNQPDHTPPPSPQPLDRKFRPVQPYVPSHMRL
jgi:transposase InsO family protein